MEIISSVRVALRRFLEIKKEGQLTNVNRCQTKESLLTKEVLPVQDTKKRAYMLYTCFHTKKETLAANLAECDFRKSICAGQEAIRRQITSLQALQQAPRVSSETAMLPMGGK